MTSYLVGNKYKGALCYVHVCGLSLYKFGNNSYKDIMKSAHGACEKASHFVHDTTSISSCLH